MLYNVYKGKDNISINGKLNCIGNPKTSDSKVCVYERIESFFDKRPEYHNIEIEMYNIILENNVKLSDYYKQIIDYREKLEPYIKRTDKYIHCGGWENDYFKYYGKIFNRGYRYNQVHNYKYFIDLIMNFNSLFNEDAMIIRLLTDNQEYILYEPIIKELKLYYEDDYIQNVSLIKEKLLSISKIKQNIISARDEYTKKLNLLKEDIAKKYNISVDDLR